MEWFEASVEDLSNDLLTADGNDLYRLIGQVTILKDFVGHVRSSSSDLERIARSKGATAANATP